MWVTEGDRVRGSAASLAERLCLSVTDSIRRGGYASQASHSLLS
jgi:hypothetical protein